MLKQRVQNEMKAAMKAGDKRRLGAIRLLLAAIKQREVDDRIELNDSAVLKILDKMVKQRRDSISQFEKAGRAELVEQEAYEIEVLQTYMPEALSSEEISALITEAIEKTGAETMRDMGKVMGLIKPKLEGRADMGAVSKQVKNQLSS